MKHGTLLVLFSAGPTSLELAYVLSSFTHTAHHGCAYIVPTDRLCFARSRLAVAALEPCC